MLSPRTPRANPRCLDLRWLAAGAVAIAISIGLVWFSQLWVERIVGDPQIPALSAGTTGTYSVRADAAPVTPAERQKELRGYLSVVAGIAERDGRDGISASLGIDSTASLEAKETVLLRERGVQWEACYGDDVMWVCALSGGTKLTFGHGETLAGARADLT